MSSRGYGQLLVWVGIAGVLILLGLLGALGIIGGN
jgi:hypothetical protein